MSSRSKPEQGVFTAREREFIRHAMGQHFGQYPRLADGISLRTWRTGERKGQPKISPAVQSMLDRGLVAIRQEGRWPVVLFTEDGLAALRELLLDRRAMDPARFAHLRRELGLEPADG
jgi:hypothetical protein